MNSKPSKKPLLIGGGIAVAIFGLLIFTNHKTRVRQATAVAEVSSVRHSGQSHGNEKSGGQNPNAQPKELLVQYASPAPHIAPLLPDPTPAPGKATLKIGDKVVSPPLYGSAYERVSIQPHGTAQVELSWPDDNISRGVYVDAIQGGQIDGQKSKSFDFAAGKTIRFNFTANQESGIYQVLLRRGTTEQVLDFWVPTNRPAQDPHAL